MRLLYGMRYTDICAFRAIRRDALMALGMRELIYGWNNAWQLAQRRVSRASLNLQHIFDPDRQLADAFAGGIEHRIRYRGGGSVIGELAEPLDA